MLYGHENDHASVRREVVAFVVKNWDFFEPFTGADTYERMRSPRDYKTYMGRDRTWGDEIEVTAATHVYKIRLHVYTNENSFHCSGPEYSRTYALLHLQTSGHYCVVEDVFQSCKLKNRVRRAPLTTRRKAFMKEPKKRRKMKRLSELSAGV